MIRGKANQGKMPSLKAERRYMAELRHEGECDTGPGL